MKYQVSSGMQEGMDQEVANVFSIYCRIGKVGSNQVIRIFFFLYLKLMIILQLNNLNIYIYFLESISSQIRSVYQGVRSPVRTKRH